VLILTCFEFLRIEFTDIVLRLRLPVRLKLVPVLYLQNFGHWLREDIAIIIWLNF